jgi:hypothetical protein
LLDIALYYKESRKKLKDFSSFLSNSGASDSKRANHLKVININKKLLIKPGDPLIRLLF